MGRRLLRAAALALLLAIVPAVASAHPLGNFTINHYAGVTVARDEIRLDVVIDMAEIPAFQERQAIDADLDGEVSDAEVAAAAGSTCAVLARSLRLTLDGKALAIGRTAASIAFPAGLGGLATMRVECGYLAALPAAHDGRATIGFEDNSYPERIGWREIVALGDGVAVLAEGLPKHSPSARLTAYPDDLLATPLEIRSATIVAGPWPVGAAAAAPGAANEAASDPAGAAATATGAALEATSAVPGGVAGELPAIFGVTDLTPIAAFLALATALALGAGHALTPGHGKTLMAAYLVGTRGTARHAAGLGLSVTVSHTIGILALAGLALGAQRVLPPDVVVRAAPVVAALAIVAIGGWMLASEIRRRRAAAAAHDHDHGAHDHGHPAAHEHEHEPGGGRHSHLPAGGALSWRSLFALGLAGGLIPSTSALLILLGSIAAGRAPFGVVLVVAFGLGMAIVMTGVGLAIVFARSRLERLPARSRLGAVAAHAPLVASVVVLSLGLWLTVQATAGGTVL